MSFLTYSIGGIPAGCVYALVAIGLVLIYKTTGVFNLAFGAQAYVSAALYYVTVAQHGWPKLAGFAFSVLLVGPLIGLLLDRGLFRFMHSATTTAKVATSIGLLVGIPPIVQFFWGAGAHQAPPYLTPGIARNETPPVYHLGADIHLDLNQLMTIGVTVFVVVLLTILFRYSAIGLKMRAVVESPRMVELAGIDSQRVSTFAWMLSSLLAGLAGVLIAPLQNNVDPIQLTYLLVTALAAAAFGGLYSLPMTFVGGVLLGVLQNAMTSFLPLGSAFARELRPSFPFIVLVLLLLFWPPIRKRTKEIADPLAGCEPPPASRVKPEERGSLVWLNRVSFPIPIITVVVLTLFILSDRWVTVMSQGIAVATIFLSLVVLTGLSGQLSLCQVSFAGIGAFTTGLLAIHLHISFIGGMIAGGVVGAAAGTLIAIPALRLSGLYLTIATLAFAVMADNLIFQLEWVNHGAPGLLPIPRPQVGPFNLATSQRSYFVMVLAVFGILSGIVVLVRRGTVGRFLAALRGSEIAANAIGINPARSKFTVFALSAGIAAVGGALYASNAPPPQFIDPYSFYYIFSLAFVLVLLTTGSRRVEDAFFAGLFFSLTTFVFGTLIQGRWAQLPQLLFGFGILGYVRHSEGLAEYNKQRILLRISGWIDKLRSRAVPEQVAGVDTGLAGAEAGAAGVSAPASELGPLVGVSAQQTSSLDRALGTTLATQASNQLPVAPGAAQNYGSTGVHREDGHPLLAAEHISKSFGGITALQELSLSVDPAEAVGLVGPNGAGKTTLFNCLLGIERPDTGTVAFDGHDLDGMAIYQRARLGIGRTFQRIELFSEMSAREHLLVAERVRDGGGALWKDLVNKGIPTATEQAEAQEVIALLGIDGMADLPIESLSLGHGRLVELGRALITRPKLLLLDEPSSGLDQMEALRLSEVLNRVRTERGTAVLLVEHDLEMVQRVVSRLYVLDFGMLLATGPTDEVLSDAGVRRAYLGQVP